MQIIHKQIIIRIESAYCVEYAALLNIVNSIFIVYTEAMLYKGRGVSVRLLHNPWMPDYKGGRGNRRLFPRNFNLGGSKRK